MIIVVGRPRVMRPEPDAELVPSGIAAEIAITVARSGAEVELVGSIGDDPEGDRVVIQLGVEGVGHAALLRDPATRTPADGVDSDRPLPHLDAADVELGLRYVPQCRVLVLAEDLDADARRAALDAAGYHGAAVIMLATPGAVAADVLGDDVTLLEMPEPEEDGDVPGAEEPGSVASTAPFAAFIADYAIRLDKGEAAESAFREALGMGAWDAASD
jgi:sugar/nucleoside kinase (ribokinase family)